MLPKESYDDLITANQAVAIAAVRAKPKVIAVTIFLQLHQHAINVIYFQQYSQL